MNTKVYWVHVGRIKSVFAILDGNKVSSKRTNQQGLCELMIEQGDGIMIADGVTEKERKTILEASSIWCGEGQKGNRKFVLVSSESLRFV
jgi:hypothetical protein